MSAELHTHDQKGAALVGRVAGGDEAALAALYDETCALVYGLLLRILGSPEAAERVLLAVYREVWERAAAYDEEREEPLTWLIALARRRAVASIREDNRDRERQAFLFKTGERAAATNPKHDGLTPERQRVVCAAFAALPPARQQLIELAYFSGMRQNEIAERLGLPPRSVRAGMRAGMAALRDALRAPSTLFRSKPSGTNGNA